MRKWMSLSPLSLVALSAFVIPTTQGCEEAAEQCGLTCSAEGIVEGNASISGVARVDAFFAAVVNFNATANRVSGNIEAQLNRIRTALGLELNATPQQIVAAIQTQFRLDGGLRVNYQPAECSASARATVEAQARCEGRVTPPEVSVECSGTCELEAGVEAECGAMAEIECVGTAPNFECEGTCEGSCELEVAAECSGTCRGTCEGTCSVMGSNGECAGRCDGECQGTCELTAGGSCAGECRGRCTYTPPEAKCEANATVRCRAMANASVECSGRCQGEVTPPEASVECEASAKAEASINVECTPPSIDLDYAFQASANAEVRARFQAFLVTFRGSMSAILAEMERAEIVLQAGGELVAAAEDAVEGSVEAALDGDVNIKVAAGLRCALEELPDVSRSMTSSTQRLQGNATAATDLATRLTGS